MPRTIPRAGAVLGAVVALLASALLVVTPAPARAAATDVTDGLLLRYDLDQASGTVVTDTSGHGNDGTLVGGTWTGATGLALDGVDDHVKLPNNLIAGLSSITVSLDVYIEPAQGTPFFLWGLGNPATSSSGSGYLMASGNAFRAAITPTNWSGEKVTSRSSGGNLARGVWKTVTYTQTGTTGTLFEDGAQVGQNTAVTVLPSQVGNGVTTRNVLGESNYDADSSLRGKVRNFRIYDRALSAAEVAAISLDDATRVGSDATALDLGPLSAVTGDLTLPATGQFGSAISWATSDAAHLAADGTVTRPGPTEEPASVTLTATLSRGAETTTKTFEATVLPAEGDQQKADAAAAALALVHPDDVRGDLTLPTTGLYAATVAWASSQPGTVAADGVVHRPDFGAGDATVTLTATVTVGAATATRDIVLTVRQLPAPAPYAGYAFSYFTGNSIAGEKIYFAASRGNDALHWDELNGGQPVLESTYGEKGLRDPFLIRSPEGDRFYLIATDLSIGRNGDWDRAQRSGSRYLEVWESTDLKHWSDQRHVLVSPPTAGNTWAPEAYWDEDLRQYVVFWASKIYDESDTAHSGNTYNRMLYATTRDFVTFSKPRMWQDIGSSRIDSTVIKENGTYYRFTKDEGAGTTGCSDIIQERNDSLTEPDLVGAKAWDFQDGCIGRDAGTSAVEGPTVFKRNAGDTSGKQYYLFVDEYGGRGYIPLTTGDLEHPDWQVATGYKLPASPRHGTVIPVTQSELDALRADLPAPPEPVRKNADGLVAHYPLTGDAGDDSGHGYDGTVSGDASFADGSLALGGTSGYVDLPDNIMAGLDEITVSMDVNIDPTQATPYFIWGLGNSNGSAGSGYLFTTGNAYRSSITLGDWNGEQTATSGANLARGTWKTLTYTLDATGTARIYLDGVQVGTKTGVSVKPGDIGDGRTAANYIGRSLYSGDRYLKGRVRDFSIYGRALSASEVADLAAPPTSVLDVRLDSLAVPAIVSAATGTITLPVAPGTELTSLAPTYVVPAGATVSPAGPADYSSPVDVTVTNGGESRVWTVRAVPLRSPVLPGLYADPNLVEFGGVYYLYATTDGSPGWGGKDFYVWRSTDLAHWTRSAAPILTLDGAAGNVPWATGNAWAPTIIERGGKYYFYFSGHNPTYNRKTIGVAVSDSPEGPFKAEPEAMILNNESVTSGQAIDPAAFRDPVSGKYYLYWGNGSPVMAELADDMVSLVPGTIQRVQGLTDFREGSFVNYRDGLYHLTYSIDDTGSPNYRVGYATSTSPTGPFTYHGVILEKDESQGILGTGHSSILQIPGTDEWVIAYHRLALRTFDTPAGDGTHRETTIDRLTFGADGLMQKVTPTLASVDPLRAPGPDPAPTATVSPQVAGSPIVGMRLTATPGTWTREGLTFAFQWLRDGRPVPGATGSTYQLTGRDVGARLSVEVTATGQGAQPGSARSAATAPVAKARARVALRVPHPPRAGARARLTVLVGASPAVPVSGRVVVLSGGRVVGRADVADGRAVVRVRLTRGRQRLVVRYLGSDAVAAGSVSRVVRTRRG